MLRIRGKSTGRLRSRTFARGPAELLTTPAAYSVNSCLLCTNTPAWGYQASHIGEKLIQRGRAERPQREICIGGLNNEQKRNASPVDGVGQARPQGQDKPLERPSTQMAGLESPQHTRFLRAEAEDKTQAKTG